MKQVAIVAAFLATGAYARDLACSTGTKVIATEDFNNADAVASFDYSTSEYTYDQYYYMSKTTGRWLGPDIYKDALKGWTWSNRLIPCIAKNGNRAWGGINELDSGSGEAYLVMQGGGNSITRTFTGLTKGVRYTLNWLGANRPNFHEDVELLTVSVNQETLVESLRMPDHRFQQYAYSFNANSDGEAEVTFLNSSPTQIVCRETDRDRIAAGFLTKFCGGLSVFLDNIEIKEVIECGEGASCHVNLSPSTGYSCVCDDEGYYGFRKANGKATCSKLSDETDLDALSTEVKALRNAASAAEETANVLVDGVENNNQGLIETSNRLNELTENTTNILGNMVGDMEEVKDRLSILEGQKDMEERITRLEDQNKQLMAANAALIAAMKAVVVDAGREEPKGKSFAPTVETDGVDLMLTVQEGRHVKVNGEQLLTKEEVRDVIKTTIQALASKLE